MLEDASSDDLALRHVRPAAISAAPADIAIPCPSGQRLLTPAIIKDAAVTPFALRGSVMLLGNFDGFHEGHRALLSAARDKADETGLPLGVMSVEPHPKQLFQPDAPAFRLTTPTTKLEQFSRLGFDFVFSPVFDHMFAGQSAEAFVADILASGLQTSHVVVGDSFRFGSRRLGTPTLLRELGARHGFAVTEIEEMHLDGAVCSSSRLRAYVSAGDIPRARALLGTPWSVEVRITPDQREVQWPQSVLKPAPGTYRAALRRINTDSKLADVAVTVHNDGRVFLHAGGRFAGSMVLDFLT